MFSVISKILRVEESGIVTVTGVAEGASHVHQNPLIEEARHLNTDVAGVAFDNMSHACLSMRWRVYETLNELTMFALNTWVKPIVADCADRQDRESNRRSAGSCRWLAAAYSIHQVTHKERVLAAHVVIDSPDHLILP